MRLEEFEVVVFDLDDTLILERHYVASGFRAVAEFLVQACEWPSEDAEAFRQECDSLFTTGHRGNTFDRALEKTAGNHQVPSTAVLVEQYRNHAPNIKLLPDARQRLNELVANQHQVWVITDGPLASQRAKVEAVELAAWTEQIIYTDRWGRSFWKPQPRAFQHVQEASGCPAEQHVYVADNPAKDFVGPIRLGWKTIRLRRPEGLHADVPNLPDSEPHHTVSSLLEV